MIERSVSFPEWSLVRTPDTSAEGIVPIRILASLDSGKEVLSGTPAFFLLRSSETEWE